MNQNCEMVNGGFSMGHSRLGVVSVFVLGLVVALLATSCSGMKRFLASDLEQSEEDIIIGQLYADEYVKESPYIPASVKKNTGNAPHTPAAKNSAAAALAAIRTAGDDGRLYETLMPWMGTPYKYGGQSRDGVDCSGFVGAVYRSCYGVNLHRTANDMQQDVEFVGRNQLKEGDLLFFTNSNGKVSHVGIYLKDGTFVHSSTSNGVSLSRLDSGYWSQHFYKCGRVRR